MATPTHTPDGIPIITIRRRTMRRCWVCSRKVAVLADHDDEVYAPVCGDCEVEAVEREAAELARLATVMRRYRGRRRHLSAAAD